MSRQVSRGSAGEYQADEQAGVAGLRLRLSVGASLVVQTINNLPAMQETQVSSLGQEDPTEKEMATHSSILAWRTAWTEEPGRL